MSYCQLPISLQNTENDIVVRYFWIISEEENSTKLMITTLSKTKGTTPILKNNLILNEIDR